MYQFISKLCLASVGALLAFGQANAGLQSIGNVEVQFANPIFAQSGSDTVKIYYPRANDSQGTMRVRAGRFTGAATSSDFDPAILYEDADRVYLYCVDLYQRTRFRDQCHLRCASIDRRHSEHLGERAASGTRL